MARSHHRKFDQLASPCHISSIAEVGANRGSMRAAASNLARAVFAQSKTKIEARNQR